MLGEWAEAAKDLHLASTIDYDEEISAVLKKVCMCLSICLITFDSLTMHKRDSYTNIFLKFVG